MRLLGIASEIDVALPIRPLVLRPAVELEAVVAGAAELEAIVAGAVELDGEITVQ
jgi:hypothetical protein